VCAGRACRAAPAPAQVEKVMKALHIRRVSLWPRYQQYVLEQLDAAAPEASMGGGMRGGVYI
jgi:hypothetical protein